MSTGNKRKWEMIKVEGEIVGEIRGKQRNNQCISLLFFSEHGTQITQLDFYKFESLISF